MVSAVVDVVHAVDMFVASLESQVVELQVEAVIDPEAVLDAAGHRTEAWAVPSPKAHVVASGKAHAQASPLGRGLSVSAARMAARVLPRR